MNLQGKASKDICGNLELVTNVYDEELAKKVTIVAMKINQRL